jgi:hypothetical protein
MKELRANQAGIKHDRVTRMTHVVPPGGEGVLPLIMSTLSL